MPSIKQAIQKNIDKTNRISKMEFKSSNNLIFEVAPHFAPQTMNFRVGTCTGVYAWDSNNYIIIGIGNSNPGNGHLNDVFEWFENSCKRDKKNLMVVEFFNEKFKSHLIEKRGFEEIDSKNVIKKISNILANKQHNKINS